ncbi:MAG: transglutaminase-like domain-containing protein [Candidatus Woesearchaeota archaeon]
MNGFTKLFGIASLAIITACNPYFSNNTRQEKNSPYSHLSHEQAISLISTPEQAQEYLSTHMIVSPSPQVKGFKHLHETREGDCADAAAATAALLYDDGYRPHLAIMLKNDNSVGHAIFIYEKNGKYGSVGINESDYRNAKYPSVEDIVREYTYDSYLDTHLNPPIYGPGWDDFSQYLDKKFINDSNVSLVDTTKTVFEYFLKSPIKMRVYNPNKLRAMDSSERN